MKIEKNEKNCWKIPAPDCAQDLHDTGKGSGLQIIYHNFTKYALK